MKPSFEEFLARLYLDETFRARFLADPRAEATRAGFNADEIDALVHIDRVGLELAANSLAAKRRHAKAAAAVRLRGYAIVWPLRRAVAWLRLRLKLLSFVG
jgi:hypothetical protein